MNKNSIILSLLLLSSSFCAFSQEQADVKRFNLGLDFLFGGKMDMGSGFAFGFLLFHNADGEIRNHISFNAYAIREKTDEFSVINISDKITIAHVYKSGFARPYGFLEGGVGIFSDESKKDVWKMPLTYSAGFGGGIDIFTHPTDSWFFEAGVLFRFLGDRHLMEQKFTMGVRTYF